MKEWGNKEENTVEKLISELGLKIAYKGTGLKREKGLLPRRQPTTKQLQLIRKHKEEILAILEPEAKQLYRSAKPVYNKNDAMYQMCASEQ